MPDSSPATDVPEHIVDLAEEPCVSPATAGTREAIAELGDRARAIVEELARSARARAAAPPIETERSAAYASNRDATPAAGATDAEWSRLCARLDELRVCVGEVTDVLEATVERLEMIEHQLGDPDEVAMGRVAEGLARCERVLEGIERRVELETERRRNADRQPAVTEPGEVASVNVLVVARSASRRAELCLALEHQGLHALAAVDLGLALRLAARKPVSAALLVADGSAEGFAMLLEEWKQYEERGTLPAALVLEAEGGCDAEAFGFAAIREGDGGAAMAASLAALAATRSAHEPPII